MVKTLTVSEARKGLPRLVRSVAAGGSAIAIGPRGRPAAVLLGAEAYAALRARAAPHLEERWAALRLDVVGSANDLDAEMKRLRAELNESLGRRGAKRPRRRPPR